MAAWLHLRLRLVCLAIAVLALSGAGGSAAQTRSSVQGRVTIGVPISAPRPSPGYASRSVDLSPLGPSSELRNVIVYLKDAPQRWTTPMRAEIRQRNETFLPRVVAVPVGSEVDFPNDDPFYHNVFSLARPKNFNLGRYPRGASRRVRFDKPGVVKVFCDIHSHMSATVVVFNHPWFAVPDETGKYDLAALPPGDRQITAWHERLGDTTAHLRVESGRISTVDFTLPVPPE